MVHYTLCMYEYLGGNKSVARDKRALPYALPNALTDALHNALPGALTGALPDAVLDALLCLLPSWCTA